MSFIEQLRGMTLPATVVIGPNGTRAMNVGKDEQIQFVEYDQGGIFGLLITKRDGAKVFLPWEQVEQIISEPPQEAV